MTNEVTNKETIKISKPEQIDSIEASLIDITDRVVDDSLDFFDSRRNFSVERFSTVKWVNDIFNSYVYETKYNILKANEEKFWKTYWEVSSSLWMVLSILNSLRKFVESWNHNENLKQILKKEVDKVPSIISSLIFKLNEITCLTEQSVVTYQELYETTSSLKWTLCSIEQSMSELRDELIWESSETDTYQIDTKVGITTNEFHLCVAPNVKSSVVSKNKILETNQLNRDFIQIFS